MEPSTIQHVESGAIKHFYNSLGSGLALCGGIVSFFGLVYKIASIIVYFRNLYKELLKRIDGLEKEKAIDDIHMEVIKNMAQDLSGTLKRKSDDYEEKIRIVHKRIDDYMMTEFNRRKENISVNEERRKDGN